MQAAPKRKSGFCVLKKKKRGLWWGWLESCQAAQSCLASMRHGNVEWGSVRLAPLAQAHTAYRAVVNYANGVALFCIVNGTCAKCRLFTFVHSCVILFILDPHHYCDVIHGAEIPAAMGQPFRALLGKGGKHCPCMVCLPTIVASSSRFSQGIYRAGVSNFFELCKFSPSPLVKFPG